MEKVVQFAADRLKERSTIAGLVGLAGLFGADMVKANAVVELVAQLVSVALIVLPTKK